MAKDRSHQLKLKSPEERDLEKQVQSLLRQRTTLERQNYAQGTLLAQTNADLERVQKEWSESIKRVLALQHNERELQASVTRAWAVIDILLKYISDGR